MSASASVAATPPGRCLPGKARLETDAFVHGEWPIENSDLTADGCKLVVSNGFGEILIVDVKTWTVLARTPAVPTERHLDVAFLDETKVVFCGHDTKLRTWTGVGEPVVLVDHASSQPCRHLAVDHARGRVVSIHYDSPVGWSSRVHVTTLGGEVLATRDVPAKYNAVVAGDTLALEGNGLSRWFIPTAGGEPSRAPPVGVTFEAIGVGSRFLELGPASTLRLRDFSTEPAGKPVALPSTRGVPRTGAFTPDGEGLFVFSQKDLSGQNNSIALLDASTLEERASSPITWASTYELAPQTSTLAAMNGTDVHFFDTVTGAPLGVASVGAPRRP